MMTVITRVNKLFLSLALLCTRTLATTAYYYYYYYYYCYYFFLFFFSLSCIGFFDQWLIGGLLDSCVAIIWAGKTHVHCVYVYITILEHNKVSDKTLTTKRIQTILDFPFHKTENQFDIKALLNSLL